MKRRATEPVPKRAKFDFERMKSAAMHADASVRKEVFIDYFERFAEFPTYLFDNEREIDKRLSTTIADLINDPETSKELRKGIDSLLQRLPV